MSIVPDLPCLLVMVCILEDPVIAQSPAYHDHQPHRLLLNFPDTTELRRVGCSCLAHRGLLEPK
jgi:hypothetical protein